METSMIEAAGQALVILMDPFRMLMLASGVVVGLTLGIIPGIGGMVGMALLLPFTFSLEPFAAFAMLLGMLSVTNNSDTIPAVLFGVPGSSASQATVLDGLQMTKKGEAGRALSAAYTASLLGGLFGALVLGLTLPLLRPFMMLIGSPELLALSIFGISMVAVLSGNAPLRGLAAAGVGIMLAMIGSDPQTGTMRWTLGQLYLWDGLPLVPMVMGLFALPEIADMVINRQAIASNAKFNVRQGMLKGALDTFRHWWLAVRCGGLGALVGALPGLGPSVVDWLAYGHAAQTEKNAHKTFGTGDVRGVIAPESASNSLTGGALVPTIAFGIPGSASMAIMLGAFMIHGLAPGPSMLTEHLDVTYAMVWSIALANIIGAGLCFAFSGQLAKVALLPYTIIAPIVLVIMYVGAFQSSRHWGDLGVLIIFGVIGWTMKRMKWPRPPLILGFVLGAIIERYLFISIGRYGLDWLTRPAVVVLLMLSVAGLLRSFMQDIKAQGGVHNALMRFGRPVFYATDLFYVAFIGVVGALVAMAWNWPTNAKIAPLIVGWSALGFASVSLVYQVFRREGAASIVLTEEQKKHQKLHMDLAAVSDLPLEQTLRRAAMFLGWVLGFTGSVALIGVIPSIPIFIVAFQRMEGRLPLWRCLLTAILLVGFVYIVFDQLLNLPWPRTQLGQFFPAARIIPSV